MDAGPKRTAAHGIAAAGAGAKAPIAPRARPLPAFFYRLATRAQRCYLKSDSIERYEIAVGAAAFARVDALMAALAGGAPSIVQRAAQALGDELCRLLGVRPVRIEVRSVRPRNSRAELHGLFYPRGAGRPSSEPLIVLWMRTAQRHEVVKPKTFIRTLMHELGHYFDYAHLRLDDSYHSGGFFKRESFLVRILTARAATPAHPDDPATPMLLG
ncbi:MAG: hypothetical protein IVW56_08755 [Candidatus Binataceae bacterium]|nr:hypothetical protein [Candidatus Binataceae bacterium]